MIPLIETAADVTKVHATITINLNFPGSNPRDWASSSPIDRTFKCHLKIIMTVTPMRRGMIIIDNLLKLTADKLPISQ